MGAAGSVAHKGFPGNHPRKLVDRLWGGKLRVNVLHSCAQTQTMVLLVFSWYWEALCGWSANNMNVFVNIISSTVEEWI